MQLKVSGAEFVQEDLVEIRKPFAVIEIIKAESEREAEFPLSVDICLGHEVIWRSSSATPTIIPLTDRIWPESDGTSPDTFPTGAATSHSHVRSSRRKAKPTSRVRGM